MVLGGGDVSDLGGWKSLFCRYCIRGCRRMWVTRIDSGVEDPDGIRSNIVIAASIFDGSSYSLVAMVSSERHIFVTFSAHPSSTSACMFDLICYRRLLPILLPKPVTWHRYLRPINLLSLFCHLPTVVYYAELLAAADGRHITILPCVAGTTQSRINCPCLVSEFSKDKDTCAANSTCWDAERVDLTAW